MTSPVNVEHYSDSLMGFFNRNETVQLMNLLAYPRFLTKTLIHFYKSISYSREPASFPLLETSWLQEAAQNHLCLPKGTEYTVFNLCVQESNS